MKNKKRSKKRYAWKAKHINKQRSRHAHITIYWNWCVGRNPPKDYTRCYWKANRAQERNGIYQFLAGNENYYFPYHHRHSAKWDWW